MLNNIKILFICLTLSLFHCYSFKKERKLNPQRWKTKIQFEIIVTTRKFPIEIILFKYFLKETSTVTKIIKIYTIQFKFSIHRYCHNTKVTIHQVRQFLHIGQFSSFGLSVCILIILLFSQLQNTC